MESEKVNKHPGGFRVNSFYTIISGICRIEPGNELQKRNPEPFFHWSKRLPHDELNGTYTHLSYNYYDNYLNNLFPEIKFTEKLQKETGNIAVKHLTRAELINAPYELKIRINELPVDFRISFIDFYVFPENIGIFCFKCEITDPVEISIDLIPDFLRSVRLLNSEIEFRNQILTMKQFVQDHVIQSIPYKKDWYSYNPQLKLYSIIDIPANSVDATSFDRLLYDVGNVSEIGTSSGKGLFAPSEEYFLYQMNQNKISVFHNWTALALFDTFTRIGIDLKDQHKTWELDYFNIYVCVYYIKSFLYLTNTELSDVTNYSRRNEAVKDMFVEFINDYNLSHISYKFLPNLLYEKLLHAMEIKTEISTMEKKIQRINENNQKRRALLLNNAISIILFLSIFSVICDFSDWIVSMGVPDDVVFPWLSISVLTAIIVVLVFVFARSRN